jgi:hypothetical protein
MMMIGAKYHVILKRVLGINHHNTRPPGTTTTTTTTTTITTNAKDPTKKAHVVYHLLEQHRRQHIYGFLLHVHSASDKNHHFPSLLRVSTSMN